MKQLLPALCLLASAAPAISQCPTQYVLDDGMGSFNIGPSDFDAVMTWGNTFVTEPSCRWITEVSVSFAGSLPEGTPITIIIYVDPDGDGDPTNAVVASAASHRSGTTSSSGFVTYAVRPTDAGERGDFFVAVAAFLPRRQAAARMDGDTLGERSWLFYDGQLLVDLGSAPFILRMSDAPFNGTWMVRAQGQPEGCTIDLDGDGAATVFDFVEFQNDFMKGDLKADFTGDLTLDFFDFPAFLNLFGSGC